MSYRGIQPPDDELQHRHEERQRLLRETMTTAEAAKRYGVHAASLNKHLQGVSAWYPSPSVPRYAIEDIEEAVERIRRRRSL